MESSVVAGVGARSVLGTETRFVLQRVASGSGGLTVSDLLTASAESVPDAKALVYGSVKDKPRVWTYRELDRYVTRIAQYLAERYREGSRVAIWAPNSPEWVVLQIACARAGMVVVPINPAYLAGETAFLLGSSQSVAVFHGGDYRGRNLETELDSVRNDLPGLQDIGFIGDLSGLHSAIDSVRLSTVDPSAVGQIQFTSGTTGRPKGALLRYSTLVDVAIQTLARAGILDIELIWVNAMPLHHVGGCGMPLLGPLASGGTEVLMAEFSAAEVLDLVERERATVTLAVPTMLTAMLEEQRRNPRDLSSLKVIFTGASDVPVSLVERVRTELAPHVLITFGQTETHGSIAGTDIYDSDIDIAETVGRANAFVDIEVADPITGEKCEDGCVGEIRVRGHQVMDGYMDDGPGEQFVDGWLRTGDLGSLDSRGYLRVSGRLKDMIIRGGENIYPREVEEQLLLHADVAEAAVVGLSDPRWGESVAAFVRLKNDSDTPNGDKLTLVDVAKFARARIAAYKVPRKWFAVSEFPLTASGKVQKFELRQWATENKGSAVLELGALRELDQFS